ncbi:MAG: hypothetical protein QF473_07145 [Planctomycetota bacterium]|jgi:hypothetical protein|nr:hypothetical protein [Planctomycetota bacterium]
MPTQQQQKKNIVIDPERLLPVEAVLEALLQSKRAGDLRKGREIRMLVDQLMADGWHGRVRLLGFHPVAGRALAAIVSLATPGLVWDGTQPLPAGEPFLMAITIPYYYPKAGLSVKFIGSSIPWCPHVVHPDQRFQPALRDLAPELQEMLREGAGHCCYARDSELTGEPAPNGDLNVLIYSVAAIVSLQQYWGEAGTLNPLALGHAKEFGAVNGPSLPYPVAGTNGAAIMPAIAVESAGDTEQEDDFKYIDDDESEQGGNENA